MPDTVLRGTLVKPLLLAGAVAFAYWSVLTRLGRFWWTDENYSHGLLIPFVVGYILWTGRDRLAAVEKRPATLWGAAGVTAALLALWAGTAGAELFMQRMSLVLLLGGVVVYFWGWRLLRALVVPFVLLALSIPIPAVIFNKVAFPLQLFASRCAVWVMRAMDITVLREGNVIELFPLNSATTKKLEVVEACSGIRSLMTLVTLAVVFAYFTSPARGDGQNGGGRASSASVYSVLRAVLIVLAAIPIAIITNAFRVSGTGVLTRYYGIEIADGFFHSFSGWVVYIAAFLLLFGFGWVLDRFNPANRGGRGEGGGGGAAVHAPAKSAGVATDGAAGGEKGIVGGTASAAMSIGGGEGAAR